MSGILLHSGRYYNYIDPSVNDYTIHDVALGLSNICRFGGQVAKHYSVAQHCYHASYCVAEGHELAALLHDAPEAFLCDVPTPLKRLLKDYQAIEKLHEEDMCNRFKIPYPLSAEVRHADARMLAAEVRDLKPVSHHWDFLKDVEPYDAKIEPWGHEKAYRMFLRRYYELTDERNFQ